MFGKNSGELKFQMYLQGRRCGGKDNTKMGWCQTFYTTSPGDFRRWLIQKKIDAFEELKKQEKFQMTVSKNQERINIIKWIEKAILEHPLEDHRKYIIWRILSPYLLNVKKLPKEEAYSVIKDWLDKCDRLEKLNFNSKTKIKDGLRGASKGYLPISMEKLKEENRRLYDLVLDRIGEQ
jgi:Primase X